jgi:hypothetical protein
VNFTFFRGATVDICSKYTCDVMVLTLNGSLAYTCKMGRDDSRVDELIVGSGRHNKQ